MLSSSFAAYENLPTIAALVFFVALCFILIKLVQSWFSSKVPKQAYYAEGHNSVVKAGHKKKRGRKVRLAGLPENQVCVRCTFLLNKYADFVIHRQNPR